MKARILKRQLEAARKHLELLCRQSEKPGNLKVEKRRLRTLTGLSASLAELGNAAEEVYQLNLRLTRTSHALETEHRHSLDLFKELKTLAARLLTAQEEERRRISRELHDDMSQKMALLTVDIETLERNLPVSHLQIRSRLRSIRESAANLSDDVRRLAFRLHSSVLDDLGLAAALRCHVREFAAREGIPVRLSQKKLPGTLPPELASCIYRVVQESLRNAARHSGTDRIVVALSGSARRISLAVTDWGDGFDASLLKFRCAGLGIIGMEERVRLLNGTFRLESAPGRGTQVSVSLPLTEAAP